MTAPCPLLLPGCSSAPEPRDATPARESIVGRWQQVHTCQQLVGALDRAGLGATAPAVAADYFPGQSASRLARKPVLCAGAEPAEHAHFFTSTGVFGSLDAAGHQVDDATYSVHGDVLRTGDGEGGGRFRVEVDGGTLRLHPLIRPQDRRAALARPRAFSVAGWQVAVSYDGLAFRRVPCDGWC